MGHGIVLLLVLLAAFGPFGRFDLGFQLFQLLLWIGFRHAFRPVWSSGGWYARSGSESTGG
ncbi:hypothetical protein [Pelagimonas phthalicica]|uniref:hypothetical protein n=1 Tax=Pelagimonas phthalicica TaxID=1037362 RepID=UPI0038B2B66E